MMRHPHNFSLILDLRSTSQVLKYVCGPYMHQPWRTWQLASFSGLSGKTASNDKLKKSIIDILWGMFYKENVDYPSLIWEDIAYQIDHRREKKSRRENIQIPPKKSREKGSQGKKTADTTEESVDLKGIQSLTPTEQEATNIMKALKDSKKMIRRQPGGTGGSDEGTGEIPGVLDELIFTDAEDDNEEELY
ncbi:hypothetical protein Tco_1344854 [Tanacetum coccineum]